MANPGKKNPSLPYRDIAYSIVEQDILNGVNQIQKVNQPYLLDLITLQRLYFQTIPESLDYQPNASWAVIETPGRNNPNYQYLGSEDTLDFDITWYCDDETRLDVIAKCKWIESLTKNDGYSSKPHPVQFSFGDLFIDSKWIVHSAPYKLGRFNREFAMMPGHALQKITLCRISVDNIRHTEILKVTT